MYRRQIFQRLIAILLTSTLVTGPVAPAVAASVATHCHEQAKAAPSELAPQHAGHAQPADHASHGLHVDPASQAEPAADSGCDCDCSCATGHGCSTVVGVTTTSASRPHALGDRPQWGIEQLPGLSHGPPPSPPPIQ